VLFLDSAYSRLTAVYFWSVFDHNQFRVAVGVNAYYPRVLVFGKPLSGSHRFDVVMGLAWFAMDLDDDRCGVLISV